MNVLISGSVAFDTIMVFEDRFANHILPDQVHILNVSFLVPRLRREYGGCAGNIAYNLSLLGVPAYPVATVGTDFADYAAWMDRHGVSRRHVLELPEHYTAQAYITTDLADNQITAFHPGAMGEAERAAIPTDLEPAIGVLAPNGPQGMLRHAEQFAAAGIPFLFDPGQAMPLFDGEALRGFIRGARWVAVNDYESRLLAEKTGWSLEQIAAEVDALVVTRGAEGSVIHAGGEAIEVAAAFAEVVEDPTGCGDAYRAGLLYGIAHGLPWREAARMGSVMGALKIARHGTQNHTTRPADLAAAYDRGYGEPLPGPLGAGR